MAKSSEWGLVLGVVGAAVLGTIGAVYVDNELDRANPGRARARELEFARRRHLADAEQWDELADLEAAKLWADWTKVRRYRTLASECRRKAYA